MKKKPPAKPKKKAPGPAPRKEKAPDERNVKTDPKDQPGGGRNTSTKLPKEV